MKKVEIFGRGPKPVSTGMQPETIAERLGVGELKGSFYWVEEYGVICRVINGTFSILGKDNIWFWREALEFYQDKKKPSFIANLFKARVLKRAEQPSEQLRRFDEMEEAVLEVHNATK